MGIDKEILSMYANGMTIIQISKKIGLHRDTVSRRLRAIGCNSSSARNIKGKIGLRTHGNYIYWSDSMIKKLIELYPKHTNADIAEYFGLTADNIKKKANSLGLRKDKGWLKQKKIEYASFAFFKLKRSSNRYTFKKGNTYGRRFKKGKLYDKEFFEKYKRGEVSFP